MAGAAGIHMKHPASAQTPHGGAKLFAYICKLFRRGRCRILTPDFPSGEEAPVLLENHAGRDKRRVGKQVRQALGFGAKVLECKHLLLRQDILYMPRH